MASDLEKLRLAINPFEPAATGAPLENLWVPASWQNRLEEILKMLEQAQGIKAVAIAGEYGSGKSYILRWLEREALPKLRIKPFYFDNPGSQFYSLANTLLRQIGRKDFAKSLWELASVYVEGYQRSLFTSGFEEFLRSAQSGRRHDQILVELQNAVLTAEITKDEQIAHCLARIVGETGRKPYFEYRDFVTGKGSLVAEGEEAPYFGAILKTLRLAGGIRGVAFLIDEFEEISLQKRLTRREAHDYLATLKRLINLTMSENLWVFVAMTPDAVDKTRMLEPSLWERFTAQEKYQFRLPELTPKDATELVANRLATARLKGNGKTSRLFPFPDNLADNLSPSTYSSPRRLVKFCFYALSRSRQVPVPFSAEFLKRIEQEGFPVSEMTEGAERG
ncbi:MAG TPA: hypothetical protein VGS27_06625 [Candidatus Sulfotelmatobacter sp.]|nr:hypothetical protein [Candidatus Sulfotelmatobacter sp.]